MKEFADYTRYGFKRVDGGIYETRKLDGIFLLILLGIRYRDWAPAALGVSLAGDFSM
jgi:hypothetical protein